MDRGLIPTISKALVTQSEAYQIFNLGVMGASPIEGTNLVS